MPSDLNNKQIDDVSKAALKGTSDFEKYQGDAREILDEMRDENKSLVVDKIGVVVARDLECQNKENYINQRLLMDTTVSSISVKL